MTGKKLLALVGVTGQLCLLATACSDIKDYAAVMEPKWLHEALGRKTGTFRGRFTYNFEWSEFTVCGSNDRIQLSGDLSALETEFARDRSSILAGQDLCVELQGTLSATCWYGDDPAVYRRELRVKKVLAVRPYSESPCN
jgi:hypothetical protein